MTFREIQTRTGWGQVLNAFAEWCHPQPGWLALDVGCGPGLFPALLAGRGCRAFGIDLDASAFFPDRLHPDAAVADARALPFASRSFDLVTASNLLFLLAEPLPALQEMGRLLKPGGQICTLNPSEQMNLSAAAALADRRNLQGVARDSLLNWAARAEAHRRWTEAEWAALFAAAGFERLEADLKVGPGLARFVRGIRRAKQV